MTEALQVNLVGPERFIRRVTLTISDGTEEIKTINGFDQSGANPFGLRMAFSVERKISALADKARIRIWNLNPESRGMLAQRSLLRVRRDPIRYVRLEAGYENSFGVIFNGGIVRATNNRQGPDWITELECNAALAQALLNTLEKSYGTPTLVRDIINDLFGAAGWDDVNYSLDAETILAGKLVNTKVVIGSAYVSATKLLKAFELTFNVDVDGITVYKPEHPRERIFLPIDESSGLLGTPKISDFGADFKTMLDPRIKPGQLVRIDSETLRESITDPSLGNDFTLYQVTCTGDTHTDDWFCECNNARFFPPEEQTSLPVLAPTGS